MSSSRPRLTGSGRIGESRLMQRLVSSIEGEVHFDPFTRGRYSTDASHYQIEPIGVVIPKTEDEDGNPLPRLTICPTPENVADLAVFLASPASDGLTGEEYPVRTWMKSERFWK